MALNIITVTVFVVFVCSLFYYAANKNDKYNNIFTEADKHKDDVIDEN